MSETNSYDVVESEKEPNCEEGLNQTISEELPPSKESADTVPIQPKEPEQPPKKYRTPKQIAAYERMNKARKENVERRRLERRNNANANIRSARGLENKEMENLKSVLDPFISLAHYQNECIEDLQRARRVARKPSRRRVKDVDESLPEYDAESDTEEETDEEIAELDKTKSTPKKGKKPPPPTTAGPIQRPATPPPQAEPPVPNSQAKRMYSYMASLGY